MRPSPCKELSAVVVESQDPVDEEVRTQELPRRRQGVRWIEDEPGLTWGGGVLPLLRCLDLGDKVLDGLLRRPLLRQLVGFLPEALQPQQILHVDPGLAPDTGTTDCA